ncbi:alpha-1,2-mannosidase, putative [Micrococcales bacterium KH10]|nr:alpha-1,2-mannosidase, putative [Micrococcales bacterium KH10]
MNSNISRKPQWLRRTLPAASAIAALIVTLVTAPAASADDADWFVEDPASYVNTLAGTGSGGQVVGEINNFPGPATPFGMVQFSPSNGHNGAGYRWGDQRLQGFGVNFASQGCGAFGNFPMLPTTINPTSGQPWNRQHYLKRDTQEGEPGYYKVTTTDADNRDIVAELTATDRSGIATFTFPAGQTPTLMFRAGRMNGKDAIKSSLNVNPNNQTVTGWAINEGFCSATPDNQFRIYYTAKFDTDFTHYGAWKEDDATITNKTRTGSGDTDAEFASVHRAGGYVRFPHGTTTVRVKFSTSYVKTGDLELGKGNPAGSQHRGGSSLNLATEIPTPDYTDVATADTYPNYETAFNEIRQDTKARWNEILGKVKISKTASERDIKTFYHSLYRTFLHPNIISDIDGYYPTFKKFNFRKAGVTTGPDEIMPEIKHIDQANAEHSTNIKAVYANYSDWDTYRSWAPLAAMMAPEEMSDITQTYVLQAEAMGQLPRWSMANASTGQMSGDNASAQIAQSYMFGAKNFDVERALHFMYDGALGENAGENTGGQNPHSITRPGAKLYNELGYAPQTPEFSTDHAVTGASIAQEWSIDDLAISEFARAIGSENWPDTVPSNVDQVMRDRANGWQRHMNPLNGCLAARDMSGHFPDVTDCQDTPKGFGYWASNTGGFQTGGVTGYGQVGFDEATSEQYLWMVPQNLKGLGQVLGGREAAADRLDSFMEGGYNVGANVPKMWAGNEPNFATPWAFNYYGKPWRTQKVVDDIRNDLFGYGPDGAEPGNDDLGAMSAWYVWAALGIYPATPGTTIMTVNTPNFDKAVVELGNGNILTINAPGATSQRYIAGLSVNGTAQTATYLPDGWLDQNTTLDFALSSTPTDWGTAEADAPPSFADGSQAVIAYAHPVKVAPGAFATGDLGVQRVTSNAVGFTMDATMAPAGLSASLTGNGQFDANGNAVTEFRVVAAPGLAEGDYTVPLTVITTDGERQVLNVTVRVAHQGGFLDATNIQAHSANNVRDTDFEPVNNRSNGYIRDFMIDEGLPLGEVLNLQEVSGSSTLAGLNVYIPATVEGLSDTVVPSGQKIELQNDPTKISFLGSARNGNTNGTAQVELSNGNIVNVDLSLGDWVLPSSNGNMQNGTLQPYSTNVKVIWTPVRVQQSNDPGAYVFATAPYTAPAGTTIKSVTLTGAGAADERRRIFAIAQNTDIDIASTVPTQSTSAGSVSAGGNVTVTGGGFVPGETVTAFLGDKAVGTGIADSSGNVTVTATIPAQTEPGTYNLRLVGETSAGGEATTVTVTAAPTTPNPPVTPQPTVSLSVSSGQTVYGVPVTLRAQVSSGVTGQVEFFAGSRSLGRAPIVGSAAQLQVGNLNRGLYAIRAQLVGTSTLSQSVNLTVTKAKAKSVKLLKAKKYQRGKVKTIRVRVAKLNNGQRAAGRVVVRVGKKKVRTVKIGANKKQVKVKIPKKFTKKKRIKVRANFRPNDLANINVTKSKVNTMKGR